MALSSSSSKGAKKGVGKEFLCKVRYQNPLPSVPFPPKLLPIPPTYADPNVGSYSQARLQHYVEYRHTTLEEATPYPMYVDADYGMPIDPCLLGAFDEDRESAQPRPQALDKEDEFLLKLPTAATAAAADTDSPDQAVETNGSNTPSARPHTGLPSAPGPRPPGPARSTASKRTFDHSLEGQLQAIEESFQYFSKFGEGADGEKRFLESLRHPTDSTLHAVEAVPLFPDEDLWPNMYTVFSLDACPEPEYVQGRRAELSAEEGRRLGDEARASLVFRPRTRPTNIGDDEQWIECFLPEDEDTATRLRRRLTDPAPANDSDKDVEYRFEKSREYEMPVRPATHRQDLFMFTIDTVDDERVARYMPIKSRVLLKRRNVLASARQYEMQEDPLRITNLDLQLREFSDEEIQERASAMDKLHEVIREQVVHTRSDESDENVDVGGDLFDSDNDDSRSRRREHSYSPSP
ncbi:hypothetical protein GGF46_002877 [Coemansia sp. RSA 552]|nr:hypothetical protein GGF46_002877 [Coemansia sp. RSA 552]